MPLQRWKPESENWKLNLDLLREGHQTLTNLTKRLKDVTKNFNFSKTKNTRIRELEAELGSAQGRTSDTYKSYQKAERRYKELQFQQDEEHKNQERMSDLATKLQQKIKTYKKQIEEAEEIAALNLAKFRKAQQELEETEERTKLAENQLTANRTSRAGSYL